jgi:CRISPR-associated protein Csd2
MQHTDPTKRHDFVLIFDVTDGNPNGDPDGGNLPRTDPETMQGIVTDVCLKRKVRDYVTLASDNRVYVEHQGAALNSQHHKAYDAQGEKPGNVTREQRDNAREWMCENFYDIRMFGAVMTTNVNAGQVRGPIQLTFARSVDPVLPQDIGITRVAITKEEDRYTKEGKIKKTEMGRKTLIPYGLYIGHGFFSPHLAEQTGVTERDLELFWTALANMWEFDRSAARGFMATRGLYVFTHDSSLGNAPAHKLFDLVRVARNEGVETPRAFTHYTVTVAEGDIPAGVTLDAIVEARAEVTA